MGNKIFRGESMTCCMCGKTQESRADVASNWTAIEVNETQIFYVCPEHLGNPAWNDKQHRRAYEIVVSKINQLLGESK